MPKDYICEQCDYTISLGWYHYHELKDGYGARTKFACGKCGVTHYVEHALPDSGRSDRYLYLPERSVMSKHGMSAPPGPPRISNDKFAGFDTFLCPVCEQEGTVITEGMLEGALPFCPVCQEEMALLTEWVT